MHDDLLRTLLSRLTRHSFARFVVQLFGDSRDEPFTPLREAGDHVFFQPILDSYGGSLHSVYILQYSPLDLARVFSPVLLSDPGLVERVDAVYRIYKGQLGQWGMVSPHLKVARKLQSLAFVTNLAGIEEEEYQRILIPRYAGLAEKFRLAQGRVFVGSYDSFIDLEPAGARRAFASFVTENADALRISLEPGAIAVERIASERHLSAGVLRRSRTPCEPVYVVRLRQEEAAIAEFESLIRRAANEAQLLTLA